VTYSKDDPKILLSLRQADILDALASDQSLHKESCAPVLPDGSNYK
jgi:glutamate--cysteine ligase catalytic subunit